ncbi:MAG: aspartate-semialdehyde dehydrogenase [Alphaproteobacteria bacterium GM202ARS2]|nr:aspartate-semialdehyde dehydrogenase [Alphaproteobacteria bacterium GM202ARS2]
MATQGVNVALVGASGSVGREMLDILVARQFPMRQLVALASTRSVDTELTYGEKGSVRIQALEGYDFKDIDIVLASAGSSVSQEFAPRAQSSGAIVIDNASYFRMHEDVPLIVPEVNGAVLDTYMKNKSTRGGLIANPNCSTIQMVLALKPLHDVWRLRRLSVATYQSTSGAGRAGMDELFEQTQAIYQNKNMERDKFPKQIAFNVIPQIDVFMDDGATKEEWKMRVETKKIFDDDSIDVFATCVRVASFIGHGEALHATFDKPVDVDVARRALMACKGVRVVDSNGGQDYVTPVECAGEDDVYVSRLRGVPFDDKSLGMWVVADNLRKGAALNAVQIAEYVLRHLP